jgi:hypothetical protein
LNGLKYGISNNQLIAALFAGFFATHLATITGFWYEMINLPATDWNRFNGTYLVGSGNPTAIAFGAPAASDFEVFLTGWTFHVFTGLAFTLLFAFAIRPLLPLAYDKMGNLAAALAFSLFLAILSFAVLVPLLDPYNANPGWFSLDLKLADTNDVEGALHPGWKTAAAIILWHVVFGLHLGAFYNPTPEAAPVREATPVAVPSAAATAPAGAGGGGGGS